MVSFYTTINDIVLSIIYNIMLCRKKVSRKSFKVLLKDVVATNIKHMQHTTVSHDLKLIRNVETEEITDPDYVSV